MRRSFLLFTIIASVTIIGCSRNSSKKSSENRKKKLQTFQNLVKLQSKVEEERRCCGDRKTDEDAERPVAGSHSGSAQDWTRCFLGCCGSSVLTGKGVVTWSISLGFWFGARDR
jgi:hypothetical protein